eukprot:TRINITY_DN2700_c0_g1_i2.p1 TRINITY_DN2700_c0_g1~~TRINITY_DN2700_c0_g1_i2.p1  ORF type:complete len:554 (-),score=108.40 TRINITY_DN2700_c0_g1_i2:624-2285(-)
MHQKAEAVIKVHHPDRQQRADSGRKDPDMARTQGSPQVPIPGSIKFCTFLLPQERRKATEQAEKMSFTAEELAKVQSLNGYFKQYWILLSKTIQARKNRQIAAEQFIGEQNWSVEEVEGYRRRLQESETFMLRCRRTRMSINDFVVLGILGRGGFGEVFLSRKKDTGEVLALKKLAKKHFLKKNHVWKLKREREVMLKSESPWLMNLKYSFQSDKFVYLAMDFVPGGDMKNLLDHVGCFAETHTKFYFTEMLFAVRDLHKLGYIHRDLKPDNFMVDRYGHLKLIDFGLSKEGHFHKYEGTLSLKFTKNEKKDRLHMTSPAPSKHRFRSGRKLYSVVGSPEYMAIEVLEEKGYNHTVDYWSLGVIMFELFYGITPFNSDSTEEALQKLTCWKDYLIQPSPVEPGELPISEAGWDLITRLICEPSKRIGRIGIDEILQHSWFKGFNVEKIVDQEPPFVPVLENDTDTSYFQNALDEQDYKDLSIDFATVQQLMDAEVPDIDKILMYGHITKAEENTLHLATSYKSSPDVTAFAGWTYRHEDLKLLLQQAAQEEPQ